MPRQPIRQTPSSIPFYLRLAALGSIGLAPLAHANLLLPDTGALQILVDPVSGLTELQFNHAIIDAYQIKSASGSLLVDAAHFQSLTSQNIAPWSTVHATSKIVLENVGTAPYVMYNGTVVLGHVFNPSGTSDWQFVYSDGSAGPSNLVSRSGPVTFTTLETPVSAGAVAHAQALGSATAAGSVVATLTGVTSGGTLSATYVAPTPQELAANTGPVNFGLPNGTGQVQNWNLNFTGNFIGGAQVVFNYDPSLLPVGQDPSTLEMYHFDHSGNWVPLPGTLDAVNHTLTVNTDTFSPFALGVTPEPSVLSLIGLGAVSLFVRRRR